ncbi:ADP-ribosylation factor-binding protein C25H2.16c like [Verticillium longisporum]|uniref:ADP-ribosylation factor-binding protein C25H2.16c like n=1 Tax=Verticillium longisporum TaxID=100787 RepID=A0A8I2ZPC9_VERLO|nr:ADP-ribosylation factor-binding protein C25H2.16c like [Verticillium longisporum]
MEAASSRAAARDRWGELGRPTPSQLQRFIQGACSPENYEPNLALNLEVADLINSKKGSAPREAVVSIVSYINHRNPSVALLALHLLDICVKNCGYPFHLQISTKEFLNELVRRFPERPPLRATRVQMKILEAIEEWRSTICETSRYKEDLGFIRDMHRLLSYKGYTFPEVRRDDAAVLNPSDNLKSAEEMEEEEKEAQSAKLQELIRRGQPEDLQEANRLMKIMAGFDTRTKTDYRAKAAQEVSKIQAKARLLEERLEAFQQGDTMEDGDVYSELASSLQSAQPKIQKMTVERYKLMKKGDLESAKKLASAAPLPAAGASSSTSNGKSAAQELSLIDFDAEVPSNGTSSAQPSQSGGSVENDLLGLSIGETENFGQGGALSLGFGSNTNIPGPALLSSLNEGQTAKSATASPAAPPPGFANLSSFTSPSASQSGTPQPQANYIFNKPPPPAPASDPFAALGASFSPPQSTTPVPAAAPTSNDDDEWSFSSALPPAPAPTQPREHKAVISDGGVKIEMLANRTTANSSAVNIVFAFSNTTAQPVTELHYQVAVTKGYEIKISPQTGVALEPKQSRGVTQTVEVNHAGDRSRKVEALKLRFRVSYKVGGALRNEAGAVSEFSIA